MLSYAQSSYEDDDPPPPGGVNDYEMIITGRNRPALPPSGGGKGSPLIAKMFLVFCVENGSRNGILRQCFKQFVSHKSGGMNHVELVFQFQDDSLQACACAIDGPVRMASRNAVKSYDYTRWKSYEIRLDAMERNRAYQFCMDQCGKGYNWKGVIFNFFCCCSCCCGTHDRDRVTWFCSHLVMATLQAARPGGEFDAYDGSHTNIGQLFQIVDHHQIFDKSLSVMGDPGQYPLQMPV
jgi:hypothetical protein